MKRQKPHKRSLSPLILSFILILGVSAVILAGCTQGDLLSSSKQCSSDLLDRFLRTSMNDGQPLTKSINLWKTERGCLDGLLCEEVGWEIEEHGIGCDFV